MNNEQIHKHYEHQAQAFAKIANHLPPWVVENAYQFSIRHSNTPTHDMELDFCPKQWRGDRNFVDILANEKVREFIFDTVAYLAQFPDKTRTLLHNCNLDATAEDEEFRKQIFYMICMALVSVVYIKKHLAFESASRLN
jgi:hypothetical protein